MFLRKNAFKALSLVLLVSVFSVRADWSDDALSAGNDVCRSAWAATVSLASKVKDVVAPEPTVLERAADVIESATSAVLRRPTFFQKVTNPKTYTDAFDSVKTTIESNPKASAAIAATVGFVVGSICIYKKMNKKKTNK